MFRLHTALVIIYSARCDESIYYEHNNKTCIMCPPGSHWVGHCLTDGASAECAPCPENHYLHTFNRAHSCQACKTSCTDQKHKGESVQREVMVQACTRISDMWCQCKGGYWKNPGTNDMCRHVSTCGQGKGVKAKATVNSDTVCEDCAHGETFSNVSSTSEQCRPCSTCGADEILQRSCTITEDTLCAFRKTTRTDNRRWFHFYVFVRREELVMGLRIGIPSLVVSAAICVALYVFFCSRRSKTATEIEIKEHPSEAPDIDLFMQKVYCDLSAEMDGNFRMFFRKIIRESTINVACHEERKVCEQCYQLFRVWQNNQIDVRELPAVEMPFELIRRLTVMFWEDTDINFKSKCLDILERYENSWKHQFIRK